LESFVIHFFSLVQCSLAIMEQMSMVAQTLGVLRENLEGLEITLL
jgi:hypothetical protein